MAKPVDKLYFLKSPLNYNGLSSIILISSEEGYINFWTLNFNRREHFFGKFYASDFCEQSIFALTSNEDDSILISGDTKGFIYLWDITKSKPTSENIKFTRPTCLNAWRCHDSTIVSCEYISSSAGIYQGDLLCTASTDWCCRLWTIKGDYIGSFGQENKWNLFNPNTFVTHSEIDEEIISLDYSNQERKDESENFISTTIEELNLKGQISSRTTVDKFDYLNSLKNLKTLRKKSNIDYKPKIIYYEIEKVNFSFKFLFIVALTKTQAPTLLQKQ